MDTHLLVWLAQGEPERLSKIARRAVDAEPLETSPMAVLELQFMHEIGRLEAAGPRLIEWLSHDLNLGVSEASFRQVAMAACAESWTRDPFDRLIVAHARLLGIGLVTKDKLTRKHYDRAIW